MYNTYIIYILSKKKKKLKIQLNRYFVDPLCIQFLFLFSLPPLFMYYIRAFVRTLCQELQYFSLLFFYFFLPFSGKLFVRIRREVYPKKVSWYTVQLERRSIDIFHDLLHLKKLINIYVSNVFCTHFTQKTQCYHLRTNPVFQTLQFLLLQNL